MPPCCHPLLASSLPTDLFLPHVWSCSLCLLYSTSISSVYSCSNCWWSSHHLHDLGQIYGWMPVLLQILHLSYFLYTLSQIVLSCGFGCILSNYPTTATKCSRQITWSEPGSACREWVNFYLAQNGTIIYCKKTWMNEGGFGHTHSRLPLSVQSAQKWRVRKTIKSLGVEVPHLHSPLYTKVSFTLRRNSTTLSTEKNYWQISSVFCIVVSFLSSISMCFFTPMMFTRRWEIFWVSIELANNHDTN